VDVPVPRFDKNMEEFYSICDQIELHLVSVCFPPELRQSSVWDHNIFIFLLHVTFVPSFSTLYCGKTQLCSLVLPQGPAILRGFCGFPRCLQVNVSVLSNHKPWGVGGGGKEKSAIACSC
jgi:hypothetical protein